MHLHSHPTTTAQWGTTMDYLLIKLWYWVLMALVLGFATGWLSCGPSRDRH